MIQVERSTNRISVFTTIWYGNPVEVLSFMKNMGEWTVATSIALPSDLEKAEKVKAAYDCGFEEIRKVIEEERGG